MTPAATDTRQEPADAAAAPRGEPGAGATVVVAPPLAGAATAGRMRVRVHVRLKDAVHDPAGAAVERSLAELGHDSISGLRIGRLVEFEVAAQRPAEAQLAAEAAARELLANEVLETWDIEVLPD